MSPRIVLGPCPCQGCGVLVWWAPVLGWVTKNGHRHACAERKAA